MWEKPKSSWDPYATEGATGRWWGKLWLVTVGVKEISFRGQQGFVVSRRPDTLLGMLRSLLHARPGLFLLLLTMLAFGVACGDDDETVDGGDGGEDASGDVLEDVPPDLPEGPQGDVLRVPENFRVELPTLQEPAYVLVTEAGVPHIYAANARDARVVQGFLIGRDRYFQLEAGRRLGAGTLSELLGDAALATDQGSRTQGMRRIAERLASQMTPEQNDTLDAYAEGVNAYIQAVRDRAVPPPSVLQAAALAFGIRNVTDLMQPIDRMGLLHFAVVPVFQLGFETKDVSVAAALEELENLYDDETTDVDLRRAGAIDDIFRNVRPFRDASSSAGFGLETAEAHRFPRTDRAPFAVPDLAVERSMLERLRTRTDALQEAITGPRGGDFGSNAWATVGSAGEGGAAVLSGDGHLPLSVAPLFYQLGIDTEVFAPEGSSEDPITLMGLFFAGIPQMAVGTNGSIAWSQTYLRGDVTDWYAEEVVLEGGVPVATLHCADPSAPCDCGTGECTRRDLTAIEETYEVADLPALESVGRTETWDRFETSDGRMITAVEGRPAMADSTPGPGEALINVQGEFVIPADIDGDGVISAISLDFAGFDVSNILNALEGFNRSETVMDFRESTREMVTYAQNLVAADTSGNVYYGSYNALPTREYLEREETGEFAPGADPRALIDGRRYNGFTIPLDENGMPDESQCEESGYGCLIPFDRWPAAMNPDRGYVMTANNDIANITTDGDFFNDEFYLGGPWNNGFRGDVIDETLTAAVAAGGVDVASMSALQGVHRSVLGEVLVEHIQAAIAAARDLDDPSTPEEMRLAALYAAESDALDEIDSRFDAWESGGFEAESGVVTFYNPEVSADERAAAVATMIFNQWWKELIDEIFGDEDIDAAFAADRFTSQPRTILNMIVGRGEENSRNLASHNPETNESVFFDRLGTEEVERSDEIILRAMNSALEALRAAPDEENPGVGGFGTNDMDEWLWGLRHQVKFESIIAGFIGDVPGFAAIINGFAITTSKLPLAEEFPEGDPRENLTWFPRPGDLFNVDAAHYNPSSPDFFYANGPVMRMVIRLEEGNISGVNVLPGGQSGLTNSPHFSDQAALWLGNETVPLRFHLDDVLAGATERLTFATTP